MYALNRSAVILKPRQPFADWLNALPGDDKYTLEQLRAEPTTILLPEFQRPGKELKYVQKVCSELFSNQLWAWHTNESAWPAKRDWTMFHAWFDFEICSEVFDLVESRVEREEV